MTAAVPSRAMTVRDLTRREQEILALLAQRRTNREIADLLGIGHSTVATHVINVLAKLGAANRRDAGAIAIRHGLIVEVWQNTDDVGREEQLGNIPVVGMPAT